MSEVHENTKSAYVQSDQILADTYSSVLFETEDGLVVNEVF